MNSLLSQSEDSVDNKDLADVRQTLRAAADQFRAVWRGGTVDCDERRFVERSYINTV